MDPVEDWLTQPDGLSVRLRALRTQAGLSGKDLAAATGWQPSKVSRLENGRQAPASDDLQAWARSCGAGADETKGLLGLLEDFHAFHQDWKRQMRRGQEPVQLSYNEIVEASTLIRYFETVWVPGFLQTPGYARRVFTEMVDLHGLAVNDVAAAVSARMRRQQMLYDPAKRFEFLLAEPVLRWSLCPPEAMRAQLDRFQTVVGLSNVRFGILPMGTELATTPQNSFQIYDELVVVETFIGETIHRGDEADTYTRVMDRLWRQAATGDAARKLIIRAVDALDNPSLS